LIGRFRLHIRLLGLRCRFACHGAGAASILQTHFGAFPEADGSPDVEYEVWQDTERFSFRSSAGAIGSARSPAELLWLIDKQVSIDLQLRRNDLLFLHSAAVESKGRACLIVGESGQGKSTTAWGLLHHGFRYLSDELSPITLDNLHVLAYPRALGMKRYPPPNYPLPADGVLDLEETLHIPVSAMPSGVHYASCEIAALIFIRYDAAAREPRLHRLTPAEATVRLYVSALNPLAHGRSGLDAVAHIAERVASWSLESSELGDSCRILVSLNERSSVSTADPE
jgi:hypothetical protein